MSGPVAVWPPFSSDVLLEDCSHSCFGSVRCQGYLSRRVWVIQHDAACHHLLRVREGFLKFRAPLELSWFEVARSVEWLHDVCRSWEKCSVVVDHAAKPECLLWCGWPRKICDGLDFVS